MSTTEVKSNGSNEAVDPLAIVDPVTTTSSAQSGSLMTLPISSSSSITAPMNTTSSANTNASSVDIKTEGASSETVKPEIKVERPPPRIEPHVEPVNGIVRPPVVPPAQRPGRITNQLLYLKNNVVKGMRYF